jgi:hypothetical protein
LNKPTGEVYEEFCRKENEVPKTIVVGDDVKGHWLGRDDADVVILFFHGTSNTYFRENFEVSGGVGFNIT